MDPTTPPVALVTGASSGVGLALTTRLLGEGWDVLAVNRSEVPPADPAVRAALDAGRLRVHRVDLADLPALRSALATLVASEPRIGLVVNNAAVSLDGPRAAPSGRDVHFEVNVLAPYLVTRALGPVVARSDGRIVNVASNALLQVRDLDLDALMHPTRFRKLFGSYAASKLALALWTHDLAQQATGLPGLRSVCPGGNDTPMTRGSGMPAWLRIFVPFLFADPRRGAGRILDAATADVPPGTFLNKGRPTAIPRLDLAPAVHARILEIATSG